MTLVYQSTRDANNKVTASQAILQGLAADGGLFVPVSLPGLDLSSLCANPTYVEMATAVLGALLTDYSGEELHQCAVAAYADHFDNAAVAPVKGAENGGAAPDLSTPRNGEAAQGPGRRRPRLRV